MVTLSPLNTTTVDGVIAELCFCSSNRSLISLSYDDETDIVSFFDCSPAGNLSLKNRLEFPVPLEKHTGWNRYAKGRVLDIACTEKNNLVGIVRYGTPLQIVTSSGDCVHKLDMHPFCFDAACFDQTGNQIVYSTLSGADNGDSETLIVDLKEKTIKGRCWERNGAILRHPTLNLFALAFNDQGGADVRFLVREVELDGAGIELFALADITTMAFSNRGDKLAILTAADNVVVQLYDLAADSYQNLTEVNTYAFDDRMRNRYFKVVNGAFFTMDDEYVIVPDLFSPSNYSDLVALDVENGDRLRLVTGHRDRLRAIAFGIEDSIVASGDISGELRLSRLTGSGSLKGKRREATGIPLLSRYRRIPCRGYKKSWFVERVAANANETDDS